MEINWKLRVKNRATLLTLLVSGVSFVYGVLAAFGAAPSLAQEQVLNLVYSAVSILCALGIVVDPTTEGLGDSENAMGYEIPRPATKED